MTTFYLCLFVNLLSSNQQHLFSCQFEINHVIHQPTTKKFSKWSGPKSNIRLENRERDWKAASFGLYMHTNVSFCLSDNVESPLENIDYSILPWYSLQGSTKPAIPHFIIPSIIIFHISHARYLSINFEIATTYMYYRTVEGRRKGALY